MNCASASWIITRRPNSVGLASLPLRMISVWGSNTLTTLSGKWVSAAQHPGAGLGEDLPNHAEGRGQALGKAPDSPTRAGWELRHRGLGLPHDRARDPHQALV